MTKIKGSTELLEERVNAKNEKLRKNGMNTLNEIAK